MTQECLRIYYNKEENLKEACRRVNKAKWFEILEAEVLKEIESFIDEENKGLVMGMGVWGIAMFPMNGNIPPVLRDVQPKILSAKLKSLRFCAYFRKGRCNKGSRCTFGHF